MIVLNKLARQCMEKVLLSGKVTAKTGPRMYLIRTLVRLNETFDKTTEPSDELPQWSEYEVHAAKVVCWLLAFLEGLGCANVEQLLRDVASLKDD